jgi:hypothetical protein
MSALPSTTFVPGSTGLPEPLSDDPVEAIDSTLTEATGAMEGLHEVFERLRSLMVLAREERKNEEKIGELFVRAQDHVNRAIADAEERARQLLVDAEHEAAMIVAAGRREVERILAEARSAALPPPVAEQLQRTIDGFARVNRELLVELTALTQALSEHAHAATPPVSSPPPPAAHQWSRDLGALPDPPTAPSPRRSEPAFYTN